MEPVPCATCGHLIELTAWRCESCGDANPFACSKCEKRIPLSQVFEPESFTSWKSLFCLACGEEARIVQCRHCKTGLVHGSGHERVSHKGEVRVYHPECWKIYELQLRTVRLVRMIVMPIAAGLSAWIAWQEFRTPWMPLYHGFLGAAAGFLASLLFRPRD